MNVDGLPDIHSYDDIIIFAKSQMKNFKKPKHYAGGRHQTKHQNIFLHIRHDGTLARIEINKDGGSKFYLNP